MKLDRLNSDDNNQEQESNNPQQDVVNEQEQEKSGFGKIISFIKYYIFGQPDSFYETKRLLKNTEKKIKKITPLIYDSKKEKVTPKFIRIIYEIYKIVYPSKEIIEILKDPKNNKLLQINFIENSLDDDQKKELVFFTQENILGEIAKYGIDKAHKNIGKKENKFLKSFKKDKIIEINQKFTALMNLIDVISFDYYPILKKANKELEEDYLVDSPSFSPVTGRYIIEDLKNLADVINNLDFEYPYKQAIEDFKSYRGVDLINYEEFERLKGIIKRFQKEEYLTLMIKLIDNDPFYRHKEDINQVDIFQNYTKLLNSKIVENFEKAKMEKLKGEVNSLLNVLFGKTDFNPLKNYNTDKNSMLSRVGVGSFKYAEPLNYLRYFIMDRYNRYIRECINTLIVEGKFFQPENLQRISNNFYNTNELIKNILQLDESMGDHEPRGNRFKMLLRKASSGDSQAKKLSKEYVEQVNDEAKKILLTADSSMKKLIDIISKILEETKPQSNHTIISNIKEIQGVRNKEFIEKLNRAYTDLINITRLTKIYLESV